MQSKPKRISLATLSVCSSFLLLAPLGCSRSKIVGPRTENPNRVALTDFVNPESPEPAAQDSPDQTGIAADGSDRAKTTTDTSDGVTLSAGQAVQDPIEPVANPIGTTNPSGGSLSLLDAKIGDVNGKPIFTNSFFAPIEDRLIAESARLSPTNWRQSAGKIIANRLDGIIADELLRAEALASLTPTQRVGLQAFLNNFRNNILSENLGSSQLASRRIQKEKGVSLDEALRQKEVDTLVQLTLIQEVNRRVNVSWRDIKQRYERDIDEFSPPPTAVFRVIRAFADNEEGVNEIKTQLDAGVDFLKIAAGPLNNFNTDRAGMYRVLIKDTFETTKFFGPEILNEQIRPLTVGDSVGPITLGTTIYWIKLMGIEQESISLYDAQLKIQRDLTFERRNQARTEYLSRLMERARVSSRDEVLLRLLQIAEQRYGRQG